MTCESDITATFFITAARWFSIMRRLMARTNAISWLGALGEINVRQFAKTRSTTASHAVNTRTGHATAFGRASATLVAKLDAGAPLHLATTVGNSTTPTPTI
jgi:hypothetical protein